MSEVSTTQPAAAPFGRSRGAAALSPQTQVAFTRDGFANSTVSSVAAATMLPPTGKVVYTSPQAALISGTALALPIAVVSFAAFATYIISVGGADAFDTISLPSALISSSITEAAAAASNSAAVPSPPAQPPTDLTAFIEAVSAPRPVAPVAPAPSTAAVAVTAVADVPVADTASTAPPVSPVPPASPDASAATPAPVASQGVVIDALSSIHSLMRPLTDSMNPSAEDTSMIADLMRSAREPMGPAKTLMALTGSSPTPAPSPASLAALPLSPQPLPPLAKAVLAASAGAWTALAFVVPFLVQRRLVGRIVRLPGRRMRVETVGIAGFTPRSFTIDAACLVPPLAISHAPFRVLQRFPILRDADRVGKGRVETLWALRTVELGGHGSTADDQNTARAGAAERHREAARAAAQMRGEVEETGLIGMLGRLLNKVLGREQSAPTGRARGRLSAEGRLVLGETRAGASLEDELWVWNGVGVPCVHLKDAAPAPSTPSFAAAAAGGPQASAKAAGKGK